MEAQGARGRGLDEDFEEACFVVVEDRKKDEEVEVEVREEREKNTEVPVSLLR